MEPFVISFILNALMGIAMFFMKQNTDQTKADIDRVRSEVEKVRDTSFKKEDFKDFKEELWNRLDRFERQVNIQLEGK